LLYLSGFFLHLGISIQPWVHQVTDGGGAGGRGCARATQHEADELACGTPHKRKAAGAAVTVDPGGRAIPRFARAVTRRGQSPDMNNNQAKALSSRHKQGVRPMADDLTNRGPADRSRVNMHEDYEVRYWTKSLGVSKDELQRLVDKHGNSAAKIKEALGK
jgi:hypothetical protein